MSAPIRIRDLARAKLAGRKIDVVGFVDEMLSIVSETGQLHCCLEADGALRFEWRDGQRCDVELDGCRGKLRMVCARLSVLCNGTVSPYGGEGTIGSSTPSNNEIHQWTCRFKNSADEHEFSLSFSTTSVVRFNR